jgi:predicted ATP-grasp superfamily ATP-dependent carboligase
MGGHLNALSIARTLSGNGIKVYALNHAKRILRYSRACEWIDLGAQSSGPKDWEAFLLGRQSDRLKGAVILACSDEAIEIVIRSVERLREKFILEEADTEIRKRLLDKLSTYQLAEQAGVPVPKHWFVSTVAELDELEKNLVFPLILKPKLSHEFQQIWDHFKYFRADNMDDVYQYFSMVTRHEIEVVLMEFIPGDDDMDCSYYAYMGDNGEPLAELTKKCIRRYPPNMGGECFGVTDWNPEVRELGLRFFRHVKYQGAGQIQFKRDARDGQLKLIETNARFAAPTCLVKASGVDLASVTYDRLTGKEPAPVSGPGDYVTGLHWWLPKRDWSAFVALRGTGKIGFWQWCSDICRPHVMPVFRWSDPLPSIVELWREFAPRINRRLQLRLQRTTSKT